MKLPTEKTKPIQDISLYNYLIYGQPKAGKTTFCSNYPKALFIACEPGHKFQEIYKVDPVQWQDIIDICTQLYKQKDNKQFKTIVFDTVDKAWGMCEDYIIGQHNFRNPQEEIDYIHDLKYGKGSKKTRKEFMKYILPLAQVGYGFIFISHEKDKETEENNIKRKKKDITLPGAASEEISGFCDFIFYCYIDRDGKRYLRTKGHPGLNAGDRSGDLPEIIDLDYKQLEQLLMKGQ